MRGRRHPRCAACGRPRVRRAVTGRGSIGGGVRNPTGGDGRPSVAGSLAALIHRTRRRRMPPARRVGTVGPTSMASVSGGTAMGTRRTLVGLLAAPLLLLAGCGGGSSVADPPVQSSPSSSATSAPPAHETAEHFIRRWAEAEQQMENTGETEPYLSMTEVVEPATARAADVADASIAQGGSSIGRLADSSSMQVSGDPSAMAPTTCDRISAPTQIQDPSAAPIEHSAGGPATFQIADRAHGGQLAWSSRSRRLSR